MAALSSRSESRRTRSACSLADATRAAAPEQGGVEQHAASSARGAVLLGLASQQVGALLDGGQGLVLLGHLAGELSGGLLPPLGKDGAAELRRKRLRWPAASGTAASASSRRAAASRAASSTIESASCFGTGQGLLRHRRRRASDGPRHTRMGSGPCQRDGLVRPANRSCGRPPPRRWREWRRPPRQPASGSSRSARRGLRTTGSMPAERAPASSATLRRPSERPPA